MTVNEKIDRLRKYMYENGLEAFIFPSTDPHCGEYVPEHWRTRQWISGFDGSAGTAVITQTKAALWTDSRYFLAAETQLCDTEYQLMKERIPGTPSIAQWLCMELKSGATVGMDGWVNTLSGTKEMQTELARHGIRVDLSHDPADELWESRPAIPLNTIEIHPLKFAGENVTSKFRRLREIMEELRADGCIVSVLDEIAWLTNLRGSDVHCNPVFVSYLWVGAKDAVLYIDPQKTPTDVRHYLQDEHIQTRPYEALADDLRHCTAHSVLLDPDTCNARLASFLPDSCRPKWNPSAIPAMKAIKNECEIQGFRQAMLRDGVAMVKFLRWLKPAVEAGEQTEMSIDRRLTELRAMQPLFRGLSFDTIAAYGPHGAIVHYEATPETDARLEPHGLLLLDSGAQYQDGTTDITRTIALGPVSQQEMLDYTLVLKGHLRLAMAKFPDGTCGTQLDALARYDLWQHGMNFLHGTGHGVGSFLCVHEGPHQIRMNHVPAPLCQGMTVTNEPGIYRAGSHGVRTENTMLVVSADSTEFGRFLQLDPLTLCPIDTTPILRYLMLPDELEYLNKYHARVLNELSPLLTDEEDLEWLRQACRPL